MELLKISDFRNRTLTEQELVKRILAGEKELYEVLMRRNNQILYRIIRGYLNSDADTQDVMQETYIRAYEKLYQYKFEAKFSTWLIRIGINMTLARLETTSKLPVTFSENIRPLESRNNPEKNLMQKEAARILEAAINHLPPNYRVVYILREVEGMGMREISETLSISEANAKVRVHRAKALLKNSILKMADMETLYPFASTRCDRMVDEVMSKI